MENKKSVKNFNMATPEAPFEEIGISYDPRVQQFRAIEERQHTIMHHIRAINASLPTHHIMDKIFQHLLSIKIRLTKLEKNMPFKSKAQQKYLFAKKPEVAEEFAEHTSKSTYKKLPAHVKKKAAKPSSKKGKK